MSFNPLTAPENLAGMHSIEASAGTGKTYSIAVLWLRLLLQSHLPIESILVSTFTTAATAELSERLLQILRDAQYACAHPDNADSSNPATTIVQDVQAQIESTSSSRNLLHEINVALSSFDLAPISTLHGFCQSIITRFVLELGGDPEREPIHSCQDIITEMVDDYIIGACAEERVQLLGNKPVQQARKIAEALAHNSAFARKSMLPVNCPDELQLHEQATHTLAHLQTFNDQLDDLLKPLGRSRSAARKVIEAIASGNPAKGLTDAARTKMGDCCPILLTACDAARHALIEQHAAPQIAAQVHFIDTIRKQYEQRKEQQSVYSFDDIIIFVRDALKKQGPNGPLACSVRERFKAVIIDECQDSDSVQIEVFTTLFCNKDTSTRTPTETLIVIGDPKQSIYRFRGADLASYRALTQIAQTTPEMTVNFRTDQALIEELNALYEKHPSFQNGQTNNPIRYTAISANNTEQRLWDSAERPPLSYMWSDHTVRSHAFTDIAKQIATECTRLLQDGVEIHDRHTGIRRPLRASDIAILASKHHHLRLTRQALTENNIPCQQAGQGLGSVLSSDETFDFMWWLTLLQTMDTGVGHILPNLLTFAATPLGGLGTAALQELQESPLIQAEWIQHTREALHELHQHGPLPMLLRHNDRHAHSGNHSERQVTNWRHIAHILQETWATGLRTPTLLLRSLSRATETQTNNNDTDLMKLETDLPAVQLVTIHGSKGLEYPIVFCPFLWHVGSKFTQKQMAAAVVRNEQGGFIDIGSPDFAAHKQEAIQQSEEEEQRFLYVALTRARHRLYLGMAPISSGGKQHANGAESSELARLLQLSNDTDTWHEQLAEKIITPKIIPNKSTSQQEPLLPTTIAIPPLVHPWRGGLHRIASFSSLHSNVQSHEVGSAWDHDESLIFTQNVPLNPGLLDKLGGGTALGDEVHRILEDILGNGKTLAEAVPEPRISSDPTTGEQEKHERWHTLSSAITCMLATQMPCNISLQELQNSCIAELHFLMPVANMSAQQLSDALLADPSINSDPARHEWASSISQWSFARIHGFMQGYIDLIFEHDGRWYVADYKTNQLPDYEHTAMEHCMLESDYLLQCRLYTVALHRHLQTHIPDYSYDTHFGGGLYLFVRGFPENGIWQERPSVDAIAALDALFTTARKG